MLKSVSHNHSGYGSLLTFKLSRYMNYQTFQPHPDLGSFVKCYWTLEGTPEEGSGRQRILPDGCIEMIFIFGDDVKRITPDDRFIIQPRAMVLGQITEPFLVEPIGYVNSFATRFYPCGFANFISIPLKDLANRDTPLERLFDESQVKALEQQMIQATSTLARIEIIEAFLLDKVKREATIDHIVKSTVDMILSSGGSSPINAILKGDLSKRRQLERKFLKQVGMSPKQLGRVIRLQTALKLLLNQQSDSLTEVAYESEYYDQAHFIKDFKEFTGTTPREFLGDRNMALSSLFYKND